MKALHVLCIACLSLLMVSCDKDDDDVRPLSAKSGSSSFDMLNGCDIGSGPMATEFIFEIELAMAPTMQLGGVEFDVEWADGDVSEDRFEEDIIISGTTIEYDWCFRFGSLDWFEVKATVVDDDRNPLSNEVSIRVNRPAGAN